MAWGDEYNPDESGDSILSSLAHAAWTPIGALLGALDKPGRAIRGTLAGRPEELLNLIPLSDAFEWTDPDKAVSGRDLNRMAGLADDEDTWGNWFGGLATEILTDPLNLITLGTSSSLTAAGKAAKLTTGLERTAAGRIGAKGGAQAGLFGLRTPWFTDALGLPKGNLPLMTGPAGEAVAKWGADTIESLTRNVPGVAKARSWFEYGAGRTGNPDIVNGFSGVFPAEEKAVINKAFAPGMELVQGHRDLIDEVMQRTGMQAGEAESLANRLVVGVAENANPAYSGIGPVNPDLLALAKKPAEQLKAGQDALRAHQISLGIDVGDNVNPFGIDYVHRQSVEGGVSKGSNLKGRTIPQEVLPGGSAQMDRYASDPRIAGINHQPIPPGMSVDAWEKSIAAQKQAIAEEIAQMAKEARDSTVAQPMTKGMSKKMSDKHIDNSAKGLTDLLADIDPKTAASGKGYYRNDPIGSFMEYVNNTASKSAPTKGALNTLAREAQPKSVMASNPGEWMTLDAAMNELGLKAQETLPKMMGQGTVVESSGKKTLVQMLGDLGKTTTQAAGSTPKKDIIRSLGEQVVSADLVKSLKEELAPASGMGKYGLGATAEKVTSATRAAFTTPWLPFHTRNTWDIGLQQMLGGGFSPKAIMDTMAYRAGTIKDPALAAELAQMMNEGFNIGAVGRGQAYAQLGKSAVNLPTSTVNPMVQQTGKGFGEATMDWMKSFSPAAAAERGESYLSKNPFRIFSKPEESAWLQGGNRLHNDIDVTGRMSQFVALRREGYSPQAARDIVASSQLDYSKLTEAERTLRQLIPFYSFSKKNLERFAGQLQNPGPVTSLLRVAGSARQDEAVPNYVSPGSAIPVPGAEDGSQRYISGLSLPFDDELLGSITALASGRPTDAGRRLLGTMDPITKLLATMGTNTQIYSGRSLDEATPSPITSLGGLLPNRPANIISEVLGATPLGRIMSTTNSAVNGRDQNQLMRLLTGIKTTDVDQQMANNVAARDRIEEILKSTGMVGEAKNLYTKDEFRDQANQSPEFQQFMALLRSLDQKARAAKAARLNQLP